MWKKETPQNVIDNFKKRQQIMPIVISILAFLLVIIGVIIVILWVIGGGFSFLGKKSTPTSALPPTPVLSPTPSLPPTESLTPPSTSTPSGPFEYTVKSNETCYGIASQYKVDLTTLMAINNFTNGICNIIPGQKILVPSAGQSLPTQTPFPPDLKAGTQIKYTVQAGDSLGTIASKFNSTINDILNYNKNKFTDQNNIPVGIVLTIRVNIVTPTPTFAPTSTRAGVNIAPPTSTSTRTITPTP
jgi:LysM repeat protein